MMMIIMMMMTTTMVNATTTVKMRYMSRILVGRRLLGRTRHRWEDNIKMHLKYVWMVCTGLIWLKVGPNGSLL
jgi:hypothetical protein